VPQLRASEVRARGNVMRTFNRPIRPFREHVYHMNNTRYDYKRSAEAHRIRNAQHAVECTRLLRLALAMLATLLVLAVVAAVTWGVT